MARLFADIARSLSTSWRRLIATDLACKALAFCVLTPMFGVLLRVMLALSGEPVVADLAIVQFLLGPAGLVCAVVGGGVWLAIVALEQAALLAVLAAGRQGRRLGVVEALAFAWRHAWDIARVTLRMTAWFLLAGAPFLAAIGLIYSRMLGEHDINFYLSERPAEFRVAVALALVVAALMTAALVTLAARWLLALPVVLFEDRPANAVLRESAGRTRGRRGGLIARVAAWLAVSSLLPAAAGGAVVLVGRLVGPLFAGGTLPVLLLVIGTLVLAWMVLGLLANTAGVVLFAALLHTSYLDAGGEPAVDRPAEPPPGGLGPVYGLTPWRLLSAGVIGVLVAALLGVALLRTVQVEHGVAVIAHRGASARAPENTLAAVRLAIEEGADIVEIDVQETADGRVAVIHDSDFMKLAGEPLKVWDAAVDDLAAIDIGGSFSPEFSDQRTPLLGDVLDLCRDKITVLIELKYYGHDQRLEQRVLDLVAQHDMRSQVEYMSLKLPAVQKLKRLDPSVTAGVLLSVAAGDLQGFPADFHALNASFASPQTIRQAHAAGARVYVWTVNDPVTMSRMIGRGVDGLITDDPAMARGVIEQRGALSPAERLLLELADLFGVAPRIGEQ